MTERVAATPLPPSPDDLERWGLDPAWSTSLSVPSHDGDRYRWHLLDAVPDGAGARPTIVCVHGNPTWSWMWASFLRRFEADGCRVIAPDQLGMGYSSRTGGARSYERRVADLDDALAALGVVGEVVLVGHDWGGAVAMGWAARHPGRVAAMILANTGIAVPGGRSAPWLIRVAAARGLHTFVTRRTSIFVRGTGWLSRRRLGRGERAALAAPYRRSADRAAVAGFVADVPFDDRHPSAAMIGEVAEAIGSIEAPVLLLWGGRDPVFDDDFAADLLARMPQADIHRFPAAGHLVVPETATPTWSGPSAAEVAGDWLAEQRSSSRPTPSPEPIGDPGTITPGTITPGARADRPVWAALGERAVETPDAVAFHDDASGRSVTFAELDRRVAGAVVGLADRGLRRGDRVALLVPPSVELVTVVYACWRLGLVTVIADRGLGLAGLGRAVRGARVTAVLGPRRALRASRALRWAPSARAIDVDELLGGAITHAAGPMSEALAGVEPPVGDDLAAVLFTSGATGPAKGVRYTHRRLAGQRDALAALYGIEPTDRFVAAFAPFALYGPALGITSAVPDVDVTAPGTLTAATLDRACRAVGATMVFASPSALANVVRTADGPLRALADVRLVMSAGAPVPVETLRAVSRLAPAAELHTPYGMTEALPVADVELAEIEAASRTDRRGVCVGHPAPGCRVVVAPLDILDDPSERAARSERSEPAVLPEVAIGVTGEILVSSPWMSAGYDALWLTERSARPFDHEGTEWHRSGDVGHLDADGRLWVEGRVAHLIRTADGPVTPVPLEVAAESIDGVERAAAVGVGPAGVQQVVVVIETVGGPTRGGLRLAPVELTSRIRDTLAPQPVAAVLVSPGLPVDIRHNAKIDRAEVARAASVLLAGSGA